MLSKIHNSLNSVAVTVNKGNKQTLKNVCVSATATLYCVTYHSLLVYPLIINAKLVYNSVTILGMIIVTSYSDVFGFFCSTVPCVWICQQFSAWFLAIFITLYTQMGQKACFSWRVWSITLKKWRQVSWITSITSSTSHDTYDSTVLWVILRVILLDVILLFPLVHCH